MIKNESHLAPDHIDQHPRMHFKLPIRAAAFLFALIIVGSICIFAVPASASSFSYPESLQPWLQTEPLEDFSAYSTFVLKQTGTYSLSCNVLVGDTYEAVDSVYYSILFGLPQYSFRLDGVTVANQTGYPLVVDIDPEFTDPSLYQTVRWLYSFNYEFAFSVTRDFSAFATYVNDENLLVTGFISTAVNNGQLDVLFTDLNGSSFVIYSNGSWLYDSYRTPSFISPITRASISALNNSRFIPSFLDRLTSGFSAAIGWMGDFFTSLFTSNLALAFVLISVGFGLALLSFGWRWIRRWLWVY